MANQSKIVVSGAREHNLKDISLELPRDALVVITGLSGSGKSSLAFDTIYAEGQRRYVESLSAYARQFLGQMDKPDVDSIEGLSPAISIDQKTTSRNPRSTVGTVTEIYDYLRLLWARDRQAALPHLRRADRRAVGRADRRPGAWSSPEGTRFMVLAPIVRGRKGEYGKLFEELRAEGFARAKSTASCGCSRRRSRSTRSYKHDISVVVDRLVMRGDVRKRLADSIETAVGAGRRDRRDRDVLPRGRQRRSARSLVLREVRLPATAGPSMPELEPRIFSFNSPHGACQRCTGLGSQMEIDPELVVPDPTLSIGEGAIAPWASGASSYYEQITQAIAETLRRRPRRAVGRAARGRSATCSCTAPTASGSRSPTSNRYGRKRSYATRFEGDRPQPRAPLPARPTRSSSREKIEEYMSVRPCPACKGARLRPESRAVLVGGMAIHEFTRADACSARCTWLDERASCRRPSATSRG